MRIVSSKSLFLMTLTCQHMSKLLFFISFLKIQLSCHQLVIHFSLSFVKIRHQGIPKTLSVRPILMIMLFLSEGLYNKVSINPFGGEFNLEAESTAILCKLQIIQNLPQCSNMSNKRGLLKEGKFVKHFSLFTMFIKIYGRNLKLTTGYD